LADIFPDATEEQIDKVLKKYKDLEQRHNAQIEPLREQIEAANTQIESFKSMDFEAVKQTADEWKLKYEAAKKEAKEKLETLQYEFILKEKVNSLEFSSAAAKKAFIADLKDSKLQLKGESVLGFDDFVDTYKDNDPAAFVAAAEAKEQQAINVPAGTRANSTVVMDHSYFDEAQRAFQDSGLDINSFVRDNYIMNGMSIKS
jgi:hypothetical protein